MGKAKNAVADASDANTEVAVSDDVYRTISEAGSSFGADLEPEELATLAVDNGMGEGELSAISAVFAYLAKKRVEKTIETLLRTSRLPRKVPKTFDNFDFSRIQGRDAEALAALPSLANLHARKNIAFVGPSGIGKTHLAQAYGRECCMQCRSAYYLKATELKSRLGRIAAAKDPSRAMAPLANPACLIVDEVGRCRFDESETDAFFHLVDRRHEKETPNTLILTSNAQPNNWSQFFTGDATLLCTLDRIFDAASVFVMSGTSYRGKSLETFSVEAVPTVSKLPQT